MYCAVRANILRRLCCSLMCVALAPPLPARPADVSHANSDLSNSAVIARIESNKLVYQVGEPIKLRLTLINKSSEELFVPGDAPYGLVNLAVFDFRGRPLPPTGWRGIICGCGGVPSGTTLDPGKPLVAWFDDPESHWTLREWADIRLWGYNIKQPGTYTLVATPNIRAVGSGEEFNNAPAQVSNKVSITIMP